MAKKLQTKILGPPHLEPNASQQEDGIWFVAKAF